MSSILPAPPISHSVVLTFRWTSSGLATGAKERARNLIQEAEALGAVLCAFGPFEVTFLFEENALDDAAYFAARSVTEKEHSRAGLAMGDTHPFLDATSFVQLSWGAPIVTATALARFAQPGEVIVDAALEVAGLRFAGERREINLGGKTRPAYALDVQDPVLGEAENASDTTEVPAVALYSVPPPAGAQQMLELAREVLSRTDSDITNLDETIAELNLADGHADVVERLARVLALTRGAKEDGLRELRRAAESEERDEHRTRAVLAYAIGVAAAGRREDALLEALSALSIARSREDRGGEKACARFLAQLCFATGHMDAASAWEHVAQGA